MTKEEEEEEEEEDEEEEEEEEKEAEEYIRPPCLAFRQQGYGRVKLLLYPLALYPTRL